MKRTYAIVGAVAIVAVLIVAGLYAVMSAGSSKDGGDKDEQGTITVTDMFGRSVEVPKNVKTVVTAGTSALRFVSYLNGSARVIGVEDFEKNTSAAAVGGRTYSIAHPEYASLPSVGPQFGGDAELMARLNPEVIIYSPKTQQGSDCDALQKNLGIPVVGLITSVDLTTNINKFYAQLDLVGEVLGTQPRATELKEYVDSVIGDLKSRVASISEADRPTVYVGGLSYGSNHGLDWTTTNYVPFVYLNATNIITTSLLSTGTGQINVEEIWAKNPDYVFVDLAGLSLAKQQYAQYKTSLDEINAFKDGHVYGVLQTNWYASNWDTVLASCYFVGKVLYPDQFADVNIGEKANEIYTEMLGSAIYDQVVQNTGGTFGPISLAS
ncbi:MAG: ABC transporter substrate-binding protein [Methanomassiliicoccus sp.]|nr:ABC transporter substrate-binding protein [Methanomassiliicoccus sp.]